MKALISGVTGQDGRYLSELLDKHGYEVYGLVRGQSNPKLAVCMAENPRLIAVEGDLTDQASLMRVVDAIQPDEVYNLAAVSHVGYSFGQPEATANVTGLGALRMLEAVKACAPQARYYQASSSEQFGKVRETPQTETTPFHPRSPYGAAKAFAHHLTVNYREAYDLHASCGILFNHESPRRGTEFVTRKITLGFAKIAAGLQTHLTLGNLNAKRDWGFAGDYVEGMWRMLQQPEPDDYVVATGQTHTVRDVVVAAATHFDLDWHEVVHVTDAERRPAEVDLLCGDAGKAATQLGWQPRTVFKDLIGAMCEHDEWHVARGVTHV